MLHDILKIVRDSDIKLPAPTFSCKYCKKEFRRESTLIAHSCEPKRRAMQEKETGVQFGLRAYLRFYELTQGSAKFKTYEDFSSNSFYLAFVKFGRHIVEIRAVNPAAFIEYVIKQSKKIDRWCDETIYLEYLYQYMRKEAADDTLDRGFNEMQRWADTHQNNFVNYFSVASANRICQHIRNGRVSPWIVYNCKSGVEFLESLNDEQINLIINWIDPEFWQKRFKDYVADTEYIKMVLQEAGL